jgi:hypothetical protein
MNRRVHGVGERIARILLLILVGLLMCSVPPAQAGWTITQLTNNNVDDLHPDISGTNVVWQSYDGTDYEIYMATWDGGTVPAPGAVLLGGIGAGLVGWLRQRRRL